MDSLVATRLLWGYFGDLHVIRLVQEAEMGNGNAHRLVVLDILGEVVGIGLGPVSARCASHTTEVSSLKDVISCLYCLVELWVCLRLSLCRWSS